jgi:hypothetical protein
MPSVTNVGGSLTSALALTALAAAVRLLRGAAAGRGRGGFFGLFGGGGSIDDDDDEHHRGRSRRAVGRYFAPISPTSLRMLVRRGDAFCVKERWTREREGRKARKPKTQLHRFRRQNFFDLNLDISTSHLQRHHNLSPLQIDTCPFPYVLFDVRPQEEASAGGPLVGDLAGALRVQRAFSFF